MQFVLGTCWSAAQCMPLQVCLLQRCMIHDRYPNLAPKAARRLINTGTTHQACPQVDVVDGASQGLQEALHGEGRQLPEAARRLTAFLDDVITQAFLDDATVMGVVGRLIHRALQLPAIAQVRLRLVWGSIGARCSQQLPVSCSAGHRPPHTRCKA